MTCSSETILLGFAWFSMDRELHEFGTNYANPYGKHKTDKRGDVYGGITKGGTSKKRIER